MPIRNKIICNSNKVFTTRRKTKNNIILRNKDKKIAKPVVITSTKVIVKKNIVKPIILNSTKVVKKTNRKDLVNIIKNKKGPFIKAIGGSSEGCSLSTLQEYVQNKSIIIVGNSSEIVQEKYGQQIDSYDIVIRLNHGHPQQKYVENMGRKHNIWSHGFLNQRLQIAEYNKIKNIIDFHIETNQRKLCKSIYNDKCFIVLTEWYKTPFEVQHPGLEMSTGLNTIILFCSLVKTMKQVSIVGFDFLRTNNFVLKSTTNVYHNPEIEEKTTMEYLLSTEVYVPFNDRYKF